MAWKVFAEAIKYHNISLGGLCVDVLNTYQPSS